MKETISSREIKQGPYTVTVERVYDSGRFCDTAAEAAKGYTGSMTTAELAKYRKQDQARYDAWCKDDWMYVGVAVTIRLQTSSNWADGGMEVGRASVWGIESDSGEEYFAIVEADEISEAWAEVERLKVALKPTVQRVHLLTIEHRHGMDHWACDTAETAKTNLDNYVCQWWDEEMNYSAPETAQERIDQYFGGDAGTTGCATHQEYYSIVELPIDTDVAYIAAHE
jgi:hypothetical protein